MITFNGSANFNFTIWGPGGYDHVDYYYMPDIDAFYKVPTRQFYYFDRAGPLT